MLPKMSRSAQPVIKIVPEKLNSVGFWELGSKHFLQTSFVVLAPFSDSIRNILEKCRSQSL